MGRLRGAVLPLLLALGLVPVLIITGPAGQAHAAEPTVKLSTPGFAWQAYMGTDWENPADVAARGNLYTKYAGRQESARAAAVARGTLSAGTVIEGTIVPSTQGPQTLSKGNVITTAGGASKVASATKFSGLVSKLGAVGAAVSGLEIGWAVGSQVAGLFGLDSDGALCQVTGGAAGCTLPGAGARANADQGASGSPGGWNRTSGSLPIANNTWSWRLYESGLGVTPDGMSLTGVLTGDIIRPDGSINYGTGSIGLNVYCGGEFVQSLSFDSGQDPRRLDLATAGPACGSRQGLAKVTKVDLSIEGVNATWTPGAAVPDPLRTFVTTVQCSGGQVVSASSAQFRESESRYPMPPAPTCPPGSEPTSARVVQTTAGGAAPDAEMASWQRSDDLTTQRQAYPDCATRECLLDLFKRQPDGTLLSCFSGADCAGWAQDATKTQTYQCQYGGKAVELSACDPYARTFEADGQALTDPQASGTAGGTGTAPGDRVCWPNGWAAFNPLEWVYRPLVCAFVPSSAGVDRFKATVATVTARPPISIVTPVVASGVALVDAGFSGCTALPDFSPAQDGTGALPCSPPDSPVWRSLYGMGQIGIVVTTIIALVAMVANSFGRTGGAG